MKRGINIFFNIFKKTKSDKTDDENSLNNKEQALNDKENAFNKSTDLLNAVESYIVDSIDERIFTNLISFVSYYRYIIEFYNENIEKMISVNELILLKYIDMIKDILDDFDLNNATEAQIEGFKNTLQTINDKLFSIVTTIRENANIEFNVNLKTMQDLINSDF